MVIWKAALYARPKSGFEILGPHIIMESARPYDFKPRSTGLSIDSLSSLIDAQSKVTFSLNQRRLGFPPTVCQSSGKYTVFEQSFELAHAVPRRFQAPHICLRRSQPQVNDMEVHRLFFRHLPCFGRYSQHTHQQHIRSHCLRCHYGIYRSGIHALFATDATSGGVPP